MRPVRKPAPWSDTENVERQVLAGPDNGSDRCMISVIRLPFGLEVPGADTQAVERLLLVLEGEIVVDSGEEHQVLRRREAIFLPRGKAFALRNPVIAPARILEVAAPVDAAEATVGPAADRLLIELVERPGRGDRFAAHKGHAPGVAVSSLALMDRKMGSERLRIFAAISPPGTGLGPHIHPFDQFYYVLDGVLDVRTGLMRQKAGPDELVHFEEGVVHDNANTTGEPILQITINAPEPPEGTRGAIAVSLDEGGI